MKSNLLLAFNQICSDRGLPKVVVLEAVETALVSAYRRNLGVDSVDNITAQIDLSTGKARVFVQKEVVEEVTDAEGEIALAEARAIQPDVEIGDAVAVDDTPDDFGRIAAQTAKQVILQRIREAEREVQYEHYAEQEGEIVHGIVQSIRAKVVMLNLGSAEAILPRSQQVRGERYHLHQRLRAYVLEVRNTSQGPKIVVSRSHKNMLRRLLELEVPEIFNGAVEIKAIAREAGSRSKVAVAGRQPGVDPVGACVGMRGVRIKSIVNELGGEKVDIIEWNPDVEAFIAKTLSPAKVLSVHVDDDPNGRGSASVVVPDDQLSLAIGRAGQNARLAAKLSDYRIDIQGATEAVTWALRQVNENPDVLPALGATAELLPTIANILQRHEDRNLPYSSKALTAMRQVLEGVWGYYASIREAERERRRAEQEARREAIEAARAHIPSQAYDTPLTEIGLRTAILGRLEQAGLDTVGDVMERLAVDGDEGLLQLHGIGPKTLEETKRSIDALALPEVEETAAEEEAEAEVAPPAEPSPEVPEGAAEEAQADEEAPPQPKGAILDREEEEAEPATEKEAPAEIAEQAPDEATDEEGPSEPEPPESFFEEEGSQLDREEKLRRERARRVQLVYDEETGELIPRRRRKRDDDSQEWQQLVDH